MFNRPPQPRLGKSSINATTQYNHKPLYLLQLIQPYYWVMSCAFHFSGRSDVNASADVQSPIQSGTVPLVVA